MNKKMSRLDRFVGFISIKEIPTRIETVFTMLLALLFFCILLCSCSGSDDFYYTVKDPEVKNEIAKRADEFIMDNFHEIFRVNVESRHKDMVIVIDSTGYGEMAMVKITLPPHEKTPEKGWVYSVFIRFFYHPDSESSSTSGIFRIEKQTFASIDSEVFTATKELGFMDRNITMKEFCYKIRDILEDWRKDQKPKTEVNIQ